MEFAVFLGGSPGEAAARSLLHFLWQGALLGLAAAVTLKALARSTPQIRHTVACVFLLVMALSPVVTYAFLTSNLPSAPSTALVTAELPQPAIGILVGDVPNSWFFPAVLAIWLAGVIVFSIRTAGGWALALYRLSAKRKDADLAVRTAARQIAKKLGIGRAIRVYESSMAAVPAVFGSIRPIIVLPASAATGLPPAQVEAILAHELAHIARHDFLVNCVQTVVEVLLFYHPAIWWLSRHIRQEREMCCDAIAAEICGDRVMYSRALLALEERRQEFALAATGGNLKSRIEHLLHPSAQQRHVPELTTIVPPLLLMATLLICTAAFVVRAQEKTSESQYDRWMKQDVVYIISEEELRAWDSLRDDAEREQFILQFWQRRDPIPGTEENEAKVEHYRRISYVNERFRDSRPGWTTSRGQIYIVHGPPAEIESHPRNFWEIWLYSDGKEFQFSGENYELMFQRSATAGGRSPRVMERISVERLPEPQRSLLRDRLAPFVASGSDM